MKVLNLIMRSEKSATMEYALFQFIRRLPAALLVAGLFASSCGNLVAQDRQSPIDFNPTDVVLGPVLPQITSSYSSDATLEVVNTWRPPFDFELKKFSTVQANVISINSTLTMEGKTYRLIQFHFHTPSEHTVNGSYAPMEIHFVNLEDGKTLADPDSLLVVGAWILPGARNAEFDKIFSHLPQPGDPPRTITHFNLAKILPSLSRSFRYPGSLTAPYAIPGFPSIQQQIADNIFPENVQWVMVPDIIHLSPKQISAFEALYPEPMGDSRPSQPIDGRTVEASVRAK